MEEHAASVVWPLENNLQTCWNRMKSATTGFPFTSFPTAKSPTSEYPDDQRPPLVSSGSQSRSPLLSPDGKKHQPSPRGSLGNKLENLQGMSDKIPATRRPPRSDIDTARR